VAYAGKRQIAGVSSEERKNIIWQNDVISVQLLGANKFIVGDESHKNINEDNLQSDNSNQENTHSEKTDNNFSTQEQNKSPEYNSDVKVNLSQQLLTEEDLSSLSQQELKLMRNEIFARHGYIFNSKDLQEYFSKQSWYRPQYTDVSDKLNAIERQNISFIKKYEDEKTEPIISQLTLEQCYNKLNTMAYTSEVIVYEDPEYDPINLIYSYPGRILILSVDSGKHLFAEERSYRNMNDYNSSMEEYSKKSDERIPYRPAVKILTYSNGHYDIDFTIWNKYSYKTKDSEVKF